MHPLVKIIIETKFPKLAGSVWDQTSPSSTAYNCIAHAVSDNSRVWWPNHLYAYWPPAAPQEETIDAFEKAFAELDFYPCSDVSLEKGVRKIALFVKPSGIPKHAARQLPSGLWTSKLGPFVDIDHELERLEGAEYGDVAMILCQQDKTTA